ncbi:hypothetical protein E1286_29425 [Nonomuraea terrae]|uniref:DUF4288 domain-containing protein n=1 Tax=Nonomuraea terrae TaxID=2530383 RepID=A0A4R4YEW3_9ACTN|nr:hypothetical protein [Nonomuraea terrae]TDD43233.1 hypothetical protein E1286_29425 [Nonomuraea terrae]
MRKRGKKPRKSKADWYAVRCVFRWREPYDSYEERITVWRATSLEEAVELAEQEAAEYCEAGPYEYLNLAQAYHLADEAIQTGAEVFSLLRDSDLAPRDYLDAFFDTGAERQAHWAEDEPHAQKK